MALGQVQSLNILNGGGSNSDQGEMMVSSTEDPMVWGEEFVKRLQLATYLNHVVKTDDLLESIDKYKQDYQKFVVYDDDKNDGAIVVKSDDVCYAIFRSQERNNIWDLKQTINPLVKRRVFGTNCNVRRSFYNGYETNYANKFRAEVDSCVNSCAEGRQCPFILAGTSSGGSIAIVAALDSRVTQYNPIVLTWGPMRSIVNDECTDLDTNSIYRFVTGNAGYYDAVIDSTPKMGRHVGHMILIDEMSQGIYVGLDNNKLRYPDNYNIHDIESYLNRITNLANSSSFPIVLDKGFRDGHWCTKDDECLSSCISGVCTSSELGLAVSLAPGSPCLDGTECDSGTCFLAKCTLPDGLMAVGSPCNQHTDCETQRCAASSDEPQESFCLPKRYNFGWCNEDADCSSGFCGGPTSLLSSKQKCLEPP